MRPVVLSTAIPRTLDDLAVEWERLVTRSAPLADQPYLAAIRALSGRGDGGSFARRYELRADVDFDHLLTYLPILTPLQAETIPRLLARSRARETLLAFERDPVALETALEAARFAYVSPFLLEGTLAEYLFWYGGAERYFSTHSASEARALARSFLVACELDELEAIIPFQARMPWGAWFDATSFVDATFAVLHRGRRELVVCCFSHSDPDDA